MWKYVEKVGCRSKSKIRRGHNIGLACPTDPDDGDEDGVDNHDEDGVDDHDEYGVDHDEYGVDDHDKGGLDGHDQENCYSFKNWLQPLLFKKKICNVNLVFRVQNALYVFCNDKHRAACDI